MKINVGKTAVWKIGSPPNTVFNNYASDRIRFSDAIQLNRAYHESHTDAFSFSDAVPTPTIGGTIVDQLKFIDSALSASDPTASVTDVLRLLDLISFALADQVSDSFSLTDTVTYQYAMVEAVQDVLNLPDSISSHVSVFNLLSDVIQFVDWTTYSFDGFASDDLNLSDTIDGKLAAKQIVQEMLNLGDNAPEPTMYLMLPEIADNLNLEDTQDTKITTFNTVQDLLKFGVLVVDGTDSYAGWVINTRHAAVSRMTNYNFNSLHRVAGAVYGASATGLYKMEGLDDAGTGIDPELVTGLLDLANARQVRVRQMYLGIVADAKIVVKTVDSRGTERWYESYTPVGTANTVRVNLGRKPSSRLWQFKIVRQPGEKFDLSRIEMLPVLLRRRVHNG